MSSTTRAATAARRQTRARTGTPQSFRQRPQAIDALYRNGPWFAGLFALAVAATVNFIHFRLQAVVQQNVLFLYLLSLILNALAAFLIIYGLAM